MASWTDGLRSELVEQQRRVFGVNKLAQDGKVKVFKVLGNQLASPLVYVLLVAAVVTYWLGEYADSVMILVAVVINALLGFVQEYRAEKSLLALRSILAPRIDVYRDGQRVKIPLEEIVVGDVVFLSDEHRVPADGVLIDEDGLFIDEAVLTGESVAVEKYDFLATDGWEEKELNDVIVEVRAKYAQIDEKYKAYLGTRVEVGVGKILVLRVGAETQIGLLAKELKKTKQEETPLQGQVKRLSKQLAGLVGLISLVVLVTGLGVGDSFGEIFPITVALAVAAIPEGLVISMTVILAIGMQRMLKQNAVVRSLTAAETLGSVDVICADKTGTLTEGIMRVTQAVVDLVKEDKKAEKEIAKAAILCNDHRDPLEEAMDSWAKKVMVDYKKQVEGYQRIDTIPFAHKNRYIATLHQNGEMYVSGAPEVVLDKSKLSAKEKEGWSKKFSELGSKGYRLVGFAVKRGIKSDKAKSSEVSSLKWLGVLVYEDPVRAGVSEMIKEIMSVGVSVKVITGDYRETAMAIMRQIGMLGSDADEKVMVGDELEKLSDEKLLARVEETVLFARVKPQQKLRIVEALKKKGHVVAMTGDGVNDALALKEASIGVVVNEASDVAKETADVVLLKSEFGTIVKAVEEGRGIFENLRKVIVYLLSDAFAGILVVVGSLLLKWPLPLLATQILWINLISDGFPSMALTVEPYDTKSLRGQINKDKRLLDGQAMVLIGLISAAAAALTLAAFGWFRFKLGTSVEEARTIAFAMLGTASLVYVFSARSLSEPIWRVGLLRNRFLLWGVGVGMVLQVSAVHLPALQVLFGTVGLNVLEWGTVVLAAFVLLLLIEGVKLVGTKRL